MWKRKKAQHKLKAPKKHPWYERMILPETEGIGIICMACGAYLGNIEYVPRFSKFSPITWMPLCNPCFADKVGKPVASDRMQHPYNPTPWGELK